MSRDWEAEEQHADYLVTEMIESRTEEEQSLLDFKRDYYKRHGTMGKGYVCTVEEVDDTIFVEVGKDKWVGLCYPPSTGHEVEQFIQHIMQAYEDGAPFILSTEEEVFNFEGVMV